MSLYRLKNKLAICLVIMILLLAGCGVELLTTTAIQGELQAQQMKSMQRQIEAVSNQTGKVRLEQALRTYQAENGHYPMSLDDLVPRYLPELPRPTQGGCYSFDLKTGGITTVPADIPVEDVRRMERIRYAVTQFAQVVGYYPVSLDYLYPAYITFVPRTISGDSFLYDPQTGTVMHPKQGGSIAPSYSTSSIPTPGAPLNPVTGGLSIQQQLNSMPNASGSVGTYSRGQVQNIQQDYSNQQNKVMDDLGL